VERTLPLRTRIWSQAWLRKGLILAVIAVLWELAARWQDNDLLLPTFTATARALSKAWPAASWSRRCASRWPCCCRATWPACCWPSRSPRSRCPRRSARPAGHAHLHVQPAAGHRAAAAGAAVVRPGPGSLVFVLIHSVLWPLALNTYAGFQGVPETLRMAGRNYGLKRAALCAADPGAGGAAVDPVGLKIGWAFAWRTLIAAELVFGASSGKGGLGWYIFQNRNELYTDRVFAGLAMVVLIGLLVESLGFKTLERLTVRRWGKPAALGDIGCSPQRRGQAGDIRVPVSRPAAFFAPWRRARSSPLRNSFASRTTPSVSFTL
jgi:NitT/TauT family transport system permease protein